MASRSVHRRRASDSVEQHRNWLSLVEVSGPFLSLPVLRATWPTLDPLDKQQRERLRTAHAAWQEAPATGQREWTARVLDELLGWGAARHTEGLDALTVRVAEHDTDIIPGFALVTPGEEVKPDAVRMLGLVCPAGQAPTARVPGSTWAATPVDRLAHACRHHDIELGLATDGRWWALVWAPRGSVTTTVVFDAVSWPEAAERDVVRAFVSLLSRHRFFGVPDDQQLVALLRASLDNQEEITEALGVQVRQAVELLVAAFGRADVRDRERGGPGLAYVSAHEVYRGAVSVMMRVVFLLFAEERGLLPSDNDLYAQAYSLRGLRAELEQRAIDGTEEDLEHSTAGWHRLLALFRAVYQGVEHERLAMPGHDGPLFEPGAFGWLPLSIDDRTVLHMLRAVQDVQIGSGRSRELRRLSFAALDVEEIGYVYEGLLSWDGFRADDVMVGLVGRKGLEEEVPLAELEAMAERTSDMAGLAAALAERYKDSRAGSPAALAKKLAPPAGGEREEERKRLLAVTDGDNALAERLLPYAGIIRSDLRGLPVVVLPGALFMTESPLRKHTGTHYTPRHLAEQIVEGALEPLVYRVGPLQTADRSAWQPKSSVEILALKVADIAMGSAAFLVAAARYLAGHLIEAWSREGHEQAREYVASAAGRGVEADRDPLVIEARRQVIEHCLYGVDINPMAVEMAKLSLWLVSMDPHRPFTFLDDRLLAGDSLLGIASLEQLEYMHLDPAAGRALHEDLFGWAAGARSLVGEVASDRRAIAEVDADGDELAALGHKRELLAAAEVKVSRLRVFGDLVVGAALSVARKGARDRNARYVEAARLADTVSTSDDETEAREQATHWLATDHVPGTFRRDPLHWPLVFPEVFEHGGFDAIIGNPPFLGGKKISGANGSAYREHLVENIGHDVKGNADLIAYFTLRAHDLLNGFGQTGLMGTNTLAQGDTREVGLDQLLAEGVTIRQAIKSRKWPSRSASLEYCSIWTSLTSIGDGAVCMADGVLVRGVTATLDPKSRVTGNPERIAGSSGIAFIGFLVNGIGFVLDHEERRVLLSRNPRTAEVIFPYLNGQDVNSRPDCSASRWIIDFRARSLEDASRYPECLYIVRERVKPVRDRLPDYKRRVREAWWRFEHGAPALREAIAGFERVVVITRVSKTVMPVMVPTGQVMSEQIVVFATDDTAMLTLLTSAPHYWWAVNRASSMRTDLRYTPSDVFETLPLPELTEEMRETGQRLDTYRRDVMLSRQSGLTATYNLVNDAGCRDDGIVELRAIHHVIDEATCRAYGWADLVADGLDHGFHDLGRETRYTVGPAVRQEMVDRLLELNHARYAEEVAAGLHDRRKSTRTRTTNTQASLFEADSPPADPE